MIIGVLGLGSIGKRHAANISTLGHIAYGYDPYVNDYEKNKLEDVIKNTDAIIIASPVQFHAMQLVEALAYGKKCLVEKPLSDSMWRVGQIKPELMKTEVMVGVNQRYHPAVQQAKEWLDMGKIGDVWRAQFTVAQYNNKYTDSVILNWGAHEVDLALYLLGPATVTRCSASTTGGVENVADIRLCHSSGADSDIHLDYIVKPQQRFFTIVGEKGSIGVDLEKFTAILGTNESAEMTACAGSMDQTYIDEMQEFIRRIEGEEPDGIGATGEEGLKCLELLLEAQKKAGLT